METNRIWMVRAGTGGYLIDEFLQNNIIAIGWNYLENIPRDISYSELRRQYVETYPQDSDGRTNQSAGQLYRFVVDFQIGDKVVTYDSGSRNYYLGEIISEYEYNDSYEFFHTRRVKWMEHPTSRDVLSTDSKNRLGSVLTIFEISRNVWNEVLSHNPAEMSEEQIVIEEKKEKEEEPKELEEIREDVESKSTEFIKDIIANLSWEDTERLVAGILRAIGYKTKMTRRGSDLGSDISASPDELGLEEPRVKVEVKKRTKDRVTSQEIRSFIGGLRDFNKGIYVTTSGFSKDARYDAERANFPITLVDLDWLVELLVNNYEKLDVETKSLVPLKRIYWPL
ncbi:restriction system protein [Chryseobacterium ginsenosidimutans]|uniref:restriction endonuclease n=1 Tax=Chryseobacterium ginsenosidimutans TaxID=687846 RepID=UPI00216A1FEF|nr:restriction endonuclease [Chryseobacterium ginsenosidimutans]MCS3870693.1 restriction system protein [Chryseobacterium ginsenosidimutans]